MQTLWQDLRYGARMLFKQPSFTLIAVITLALGIGANTAIFTLINSAFFRPFPVAEPERVVSLSFTTRTGSMRPMSYPAYRDFRDRNQVLDGLIANFYLPRLSLSLQDRNQHVSGYIVTGNYFDVLGVKAALGRTFAPEEDRAPLTHPVVVISYGCWQRQFGGDVNVIGREITLNNHDFKIIGVLPAGFHGLTLLYDPEIWLPVMMQPWATPGENWLENRGFSAMFAFGRLKPGVSRQQAQASLALLAQQLERERPDTEGERILEITEPGFFLPQFRTAGIELMTVLLAAVVLVLLIACTNLASLLLARAAERRKEIALRMSLGASRGRVLRQLLTESSMLSLTGGALGVLLAAWLLDFLQTLRPPIDLPITLKFTLDWRVLITTLIVSLTTGILFGFAPAWQATKLELTLALKDASSQAGSHRSRLRNGLIVAQIALSLVLLIAAGLVFRAMQHVTALDLGFQPERRLMMSFDLSLQGYDKGRSAEFQKTLLERVNALPGVSSASYTTFAPFSLADYRNFSVYVPEQGPQRQAAQPSALYAVVAPRYFETMGVPLLAGRDFTDADNADNAAVAVVNETFVQHFFPGKTPAQILGQRYSNNENDHDFIRIVGVTRNGKYWTVGETPQTFIWIPLAQHPHGKLSLMVQTTGAPQAMLNPVRNAIQAMDAKLPVSDARTLTEHLGTAFVPIRGAAATLGSFGLLALLLAAIGIYGVTAYSVAQRTRELGIRMALGADARSIVRLIVRQGMKLTLIGLACGLSGALLLTRLMTGVLYGVSATDPLTFILIALSLAAVALLACWIPARRATKVDPMIALRCE
jgi:predicted permease